MWRDVVTQNLRAILAAIRSSCSCPHACVITECCRANTTRELANALQARSISKPQQSCGPGESCGVISIRFAAASSFLT
jgi:hypothetical protein